MCCIYSGTNLIASSNLTLTPTAPHAHHLLSAYQMYFAEQQQPQSVGPIPQAPTYKCELSTHVHVPPHVQPHSHCCGGVVLSLEASDDNDEDFVQHIALATIAALPCDPDFVSPSPRQCRHTSRPQPSSSTHLQRF